MDDLPENEFIAKAEEALEAGRETIALFRDADGNFRGLMHKGGKIVQARQSDPTTVLTMLITHEGQTN